MTPKKFKTRTVSRERSGTYLKKAGEFLRASESAMKLGDWDAVGLNAVHAAISAADALLVYYGGVRSIGDSHHDVAGLLQQHIKDDQLGSKIQTLSTVLSYKSLSAYEDREVTEAEGRDAEKLARRFLEWARSRLAWRQAAELLDFWCRTRLFANTQFLPLHKFAFPAIF